MGPRVSAKIKKFYSKNECFESTAFLTMIYVRRIFESRARILPTRPDALPIATRPDQHGSALN